MTPSASRRSRQPRVGANPSITRTMGQQNRHMHARTDTGFPGSPTTTAPPGLRPTLIGPPGWMEAPLSDAVTP